MKVSFTKAELDNLYINGKFNYISPFERLRLGVDHLMFAGGLQDF